MDSATHLSSFDLILGNSTHRLKLPVGEYEYETFEHGINCSLTVRVIGGYEKNKYSYILSWLVVCVMIRLFSKIHGPYNLVLISAVSLMLVDIAYKRTC